MGLSLSPFFSPPPLSHQNSLPSASADTFNLIPTPSSQSTTSQPVMKQVEGETEGTPPPPSCVAPNYPFSFHIRSLHFPFIIVTKPGQRNVPRRTRNVEGTDKMHLCDISVGT